MIFLDYMFFVECMCLGISSLLSFSWLGRVSIIYFIYPLQVAIGDLLSLRFTYFWFYSRSKEIFFGYLKDPDLKAYDFSWKDTQTCGRNNFDSLIF
jgi:hypothetical protein